MPPAWQRPPPHIRRASARERAAPDRRRDAAHRLRARPAAHQDDAFDVDTLPRNLLDAVLIELSNPSTAARAILATVRFRAVIPCSAPAAFGRLGDRSPSRYGTSVSPPPCGRRKRQPVQLFEIHAEHRRRCGKHRRSVEGADQRQLATCRIGEPGHDPFGVMRCGLSDGADHAGRAERDDAVAGLGTETQRRGGVVAGTGARASPRSPSVRRCRAGRALSATWDAVPASPVRAARARMYRIRRRNIPFRWHRCGRCAARRYRSRRSTATSASRAAAHRGGRRGVFGFLLGKPAQFAGGYRGDRHHADPFRPFVPAPPSSSISSAQPRRWSEFVPQQRISHDFTGFVQAHHPCCWAPTERAATSSSPPALSIAACSAAHHSCGSTSVPSGCGDVPERTISPVSASHTRTLHDCVDESTPGDESHVCEVTGELRR